MGPAAKTSFDIADWYMERARAENTYLQPRKLHCLLFLAQGHFAAAYEGRRLMPSVFIVDHAGPMDPNMYRAYENGRPDVTKSSLDQTTEVFLDAIWRQYGGADAGDLNDIINEFGAGEPAVRNADGAELEIDAMCRMFAKHVPAEPAGPPVAHTPAGRVISVQKWVPGKKPAA